MALGFDLRAEPTRAQLEARQALLENVAAALLMAEDAADAVNACLSMACAYIRTAPPEYRVPLVLDAAQLMVRNVQASLG